MKTLQGGCTQYQWQVRNECKDSGTIYYSAFVSGPNFASYCKVTCCRIPYSLKVVSMYNSSFYLSWRVKDSSACDSIAYGTLQHKKLGATTWTIVNVTYSARPGTISFCDTATECVRYVWQVSNICVYKHTSISSGSISGPAFTTLCPVHGLSVAAPVLQISLTPAQNNTRLSSVFENAIITITDVSGRKRLQQRVAGTGKALNAYVDI